ncbi:hypothetical protein BU23DRAFT_575012 [Bimuria novae-zelandiae CBS 107.79]|uniref:F-box domain-containing protein n=1 Tax=Bimuria novae-zelandiae CBS 107.79 TaxID=1447943 RepID=A0A6A5UKD3_9PLEO|nr:hypothetical protein BU23DRAFT_575012 [Bimuria novae-zelandiae CBS 107.79]
MSALAAPTSAPTSVAISDHLSRISMTMVPPSPLSRRALKTEVVIHASVMATSVFSVICGAPFALEPGIYNIDTTRPEFQLIGTPSTFRSHSMTEPVLYAHHGEHGDKSAVVSEVTSWDITDADCFCLNGSFYQVLKEDASGDIIFPLHEKCVQIAYRAMYFRNASEASGEPPSSPKRLYNALKSHYKSAKSLGASMYPDALGAFARCDLLGFSNIRSEDCLGWWSGSHEKYLSDPITIGDLTTFVCGELRQTQPRSPGSPSSSDATIGPRQSHGLERLPTELMGHITEFLPARATIALHRSGKTFSEKVSLDDRFWRSRLCNGALLSHVWDMNEEETKRYAPSGFNWDWRSLISSLAAEFTGDENS